MSEKFGIKAGLKTVFVNIGSDALYKNLIDDNWQEDNNLSSNLLIMKTSTQDIFNSTLNGLPTFQQK